MRGNDFESLQALTVSTPMCVPIPIFIQIQFPFPGEVPLQRTPLLKRGPNFRHSIRASRRLNLARQSACQGPFTLW